MSLEHRGWIYRGAVVLGVATIVVGWATEEQVVTILGLLGTALGNVTASIYTPWRKSQVES